MNNKTPLFFLMMIIMVSNGFTSVKMYKRIVDIPETADIYSIKCNLLHKKMKKNETISIKNWGIVCF